MNFNPRSHEESGLSLLGFCGNIGVFQSTLSRGERPAVRRFCDEKSVHFNPRSHEESGFLGLARFTMSVGFQSTLSRGERRKQRREHYAKHKISIHALTRRAAHFFSLSLIGCYDFNPRSHEESGATRRAISVHNQTFQSTLSRGERPVIAAWAYAASVFQSTLSRGERPKITV